MQTIAGAGTYLQPVLPDGCMDIVWIGDGAPRLVGPATRTMMAELPGDATVLGIRFRPGQASRVTGVGADELLDRDIPLSDIRAFGTETLTDEMARHSAPDAKLRLMAAGLDGLFAGARETDPVAAFCTGWLARHPGGRIRDLADRVNMSERQLLRRFRPETGYAPKTFQRIMKLQRFLALAGGPLPPETGLACLALDAGYADQAHMSREIRALTGRSPGGLLKGGGTAAMSDLFNTETGTAGTVAGVS